MGAEERITDSRLVAGIQAIEKAVFGNDPPRKSYELRKEILAELRAALVQRLMMGLSQIALVEAEYQGVVGSLAALPPDN